MEKLKEDRILEVLNNHGVIAFPTETVMGLGVFYDDEKAFNNLNNIKGRPENKPYTLMLYDKQNIGDFAYLNDLAKQLINEFMPGPITLLLKAKENLPHWVDLGTGVIGVRVPAYETTLNILKVVKKPLLVPSANKSGQMPTTNSDEVKKIFKNEIKYIVEGKSGMESPSTIIDLTGNSIKIVREGPISLEDIKKRIGEIL